MIEIQGAYNTAKVFTDNIDEETNAQIHKLLDQQFIKDSQIRIMPDTHAGKGCTIGTTMTITDKVVPNLVGVDIGCGMETVLLKDKHIELQKLDKVIHEYIPAGFEIRTKVHSFMDEINLTELRCAEKLKLSRVELSMGSLGGGNHFIELDRDEDKQFYLVVHSGSRNLGKQVADYYQRMAIQELQKKRNDKLNLIEELKASGRETEIQTELNKQTNTKISNDLAYAEGKLFDDYIHDMMLTQQYALLNRKAIVQDIVKQMKFKVIDSFTTVHNHIEMDQMILRKGAVSAKAGERILIPINMRDGSLICIGKGNADWNYSAPHGAGRLMSRSVARESITLHQFKASMKGIYSTTVSKSTIDESAFAYKPMDEIIKNITDTVEIVKIIKPVYNFKAVEE